MRPINSKWKICDRNQLNKLMEYYLSSAQFQDFADWCEEKCHQSTVQQHHPMAYPIVQHPMQHPTYPKQLEEGDQGLPDPWPPPSIPSRSTVSTWGRVPPEPASIVFFHSKGLGWVSGIGGYPWPSPIFVGVCSGAGGGGAIRSGFGCGFDSSFPPPPFPPDPWWSCFCSFASRPSLIQINSTVYYLLIDAKTTDSSATNFLNQICLRTQDASSWTNSYS